MKRLFIALMLISTSSFADGSNNPNYQQGLTDGCQSGKSDWLHPFKKDVDLYVKDEYYKTGWQDGYKQCKAEYDKLNNILDESGF